MFPVREQLVLAHGFSLAENATALPFFLPLLVRSLEMRTSVEQVLADSSPSQG